ncbi:MAG: lipoyl synthase [Planctomycetota bacterium]
MSLISAHSRLPRWLKRKTPLAGASLKVTRLLKEHRLQTVCQSAKCPNLLECFGRGTATFLIMGDVCSRACRFCAVSSGRPAPLNEHEPEQIAAVITRLQLKHVVITSVTRDDRPDGGSQFFARTIQTIKTAVPGITIEVLVPDFKGEEKSIKTVAEARPDIFNHNLETIPRLYRSIRTGADYRRSLAVLSLAKKYNPGLITKSGLLLGLGENKDEVFAVLKDLRKIDCDILTLGQYLRPSLDSKNIPVAKFITPDEFTEYKKIAESLGFRSAAAGSYVRSSYHAEKFFGSPLLRND